MKAKLVDNPEDWPYSSYKIWISNLENSMIPNRLRHEFYSTNEEYQQSFEEYWKSGLWGKDEFEE